MEVHWYELILGIFIIGVWIVTTLIQLKKEPDKVLVMYEQIIYALYLILIFIISCCIKDALITSIHH